ncbi:DUF1793-domain-containing protein [Coniophora puteana RWD-64-598 SS2]|uniref:DUF1793-domain-containing protein n=1 Tax=Coniophora puteana (strain RWD-64-598) TaxID=741705 RepID=A0A5M3MSL8_CONPW|nr:DUF1793-domain-containing protein [Coniophora puteana RWD-64-598 SS2]EIW82090.1 DUF1793-domain-containing protein [Coniophora puteana RWD-64-598 SS2]
MGLFQFLSCASLALFASNVGAVSWTADPVNPSSIPLAVRTPYLSAWLPQGAGAALGGTWPQFWTGTTLGWAGYVRVDGITYTFLGAPDVPNLSPALATQKSMTYTATQSTFVMSAGPIDLTVNFLSPVEPNDLVKQSTPFSYMAISAVSNDGNTHAVTLYSDISAEWASGDLSQAVNWTSTTSGDVWTHQVMPEDQQIYGEYDDHTQYGAAYYSTQSSTGATYQTGEDTVVRAQFINNGVLANTEDTNFRAVSDDWPVFAFAHDLGTVGTTATAEVLYTVGHVRDPAIQYIVAGDNFQGRSIYMWTQYSTVADAISDFVGSYSTALSDANTFDAKVKSDATAISDNYYAIVALSVRQAFGATELTTSKASDGSWNTTDILMFLKEISSDGNVNTVDVIMPAWPVLLYTNPTLGKYLLLGLFEYQATGMYPNQWAAHDLGASYPNATGHNDGNDEKMPLEECGNMLIMTLSYTQKANDQSLISSYTQLLEQWTGYLVQEALIPANQISTDDFAGSLANQTNLAIKGTVGIQAMSVIEGMLGNTAQQQNYSSIATSYAPQILQFATANGHLELNYNNATSWGLSYNLYADKLLGTNVFNQSVYEMQTAWYKTVVNQYGVPLDTRHTYTKSDWQMWTAAFMTDDSVRDSFIDSVYAFIGDGENNMPFSDWYDTLTGVSDGFRARPVVGGHLALLAL